MASAGQSSRPCMISGSTKVQLQPPTAPLTGDVGFTPVPAAFSRSSLSPPWLPFSAGSAASPATPLDPPLMQRAAPGSTLASVPG